MKIGIISDVHGNYSALKAVMAALQKEKCDAIFSLGDTAGYYSMINECVSLLVSNHVHCLKGNHDSYLLGESVCPRSHSVADCIAYQQKILKPEYKLWFKKLTPGFECADFLAVHGGWNNPLDEYITQFDFLAAKQFAPNCKVFLSGHTHIQSLQEQDDILYCNPGSVGQPRDHDPRAAYAILQDGKIRLERVNYSVSETAEAMSKAGFSDYYYKNLYYGCKIGEIK